MSEPNNPLSLNPLRSRADLSEALCSLLTALEPHYEAVGGGFKLGDSGARFSPRIGLLEAFSRSLWGIAPLVADGSQDSIAATAVTRLRRGVDPADPSYWGKPTAGDQRLVEMAAIAFSLLLAPTQFWEPLKPTDRQHLYTWLASLEQVQLPANNWHFFRILVSTAFRSLGLAVDKTAESYSLALLETMYCGEGWYRDGVDENFDYYNPFGFHFYGLLLAYFREKAGYAGLSAEAAAESRRMTERYRERARLFAKQFLAWLRPDGAIIPYGRSLTYRFAVIAFFAAWALTDQPVLPWPVLKGIVLRHFRWWFKQPILDSSGLLTIGYAYPNLIMAEQYNSPGSPYWALKAFLPLALADSHPFWQAEEAPLPEIPAISRAATPHYILYRSAEDSVLLNPGRYPGKELIQAAAKFCKFAYSARFGFCLSHGSFGLENTGCDSMLILSEGDGYWRERRHSQGIKSGRQWTFGSWQPWPDVIVQSLLVAAGAWHFRFHLIQSQRQLRSVEGGFAIARFQGLEPAMEAERYVDDLNGQAGEAITIAFPWAASRLIDLTSSRPDWLKRQADSLTPEPNLNIIAPAVILPVLRADLSVGSNFLACAVRAGDSRAAWNSARPSVTIDDDTIIIKTDDQDSRLELSFSAIFNLRV